MRENLQASIQRREEQQSETPRNRSSASSNRLECLHDLFSEISKYLLGLSRSGPVWTQLSCELLSFATQKSNSSETHSQESHLPQPPHPQCISVYHRLNFIQKVSSKQPALPPEDPHLDAAGSRRTPKSIAFASDMCTPTHVASRGLQLAHGPIGAYFGYPANCARQRQFPSPKHPARIRRSALATSPTVEASPPSRRSELPHAPVCSIRWLFPCAAGDTKQRPAARHETGFLVG